MKKAVFFMFLSIACASYAFAQTASQMARQRTAGQSYGTPNENQSATRNYYSTRQPAARRSGSGFGGRSFGSRRYGARSYGGYRSAYQRRSFARVPARPYNMVTKYKVVQGANYTSDASKLEAFLNRMLSLGWKFRGTTGSFLIFYK